MEVHLNLRSAQLQLVLRQLVLVEALAAQAGEVAGVVQSKLQLLVTD
jgi:hypothetical protein